ncbi:MAG TPA: hypothetical protein VNU71_19830 [Burkholderiaceae bacterium]|nr:hypothetical protein [Burkholderiaceae bacterium]
MPPTPADAGRFVFHRLLRAIAADPSNRHPPEAAMKFQNLRIGARLWLAVEWETF